MIESLWNLTGIAAAGLPGCLSNVRAIGKVETESRGFRISRDLAVRRPSAWWIEVLIVSSGNSILTRTAVEVGFRWTFTPHILYLNVINNHALTHCGQDQMAAIFQKTFSNVFSWKKMYEFRSRFVPKGRIDNIPALVQKMAWATSHCMNQWWLIYQRICASLGLNEKFEAVLVSFKRFGVIGFHVQ